MKKLVLVLLVLVLLLAGVVAWLEFSPMLQDGRSAETTRPTEATVPETTENTQPTEPTQPTEETLPPITWMTFPEDREISAKQYFVYDIQADAFVTISGQETDPIYPASVTKLFTCYVALQYLQPDHLITVGQELEMVVPGSSVAGLRRGDQLTVSQLVEGMLLPSGNDAAYVLAYNAGKRLCGSSQVDACVVAFMEEMNAEAKRVGMTGTNFANPDGIHRSNHYMTFSDLAVLGTLSVNNPTILECAGISRMEVEFVAEGAAVGDDTRENGVKWKNTNAIIDPESEYYCPYATGLKTGQTPSAGSCLLSSFTYEGKTYIVGVFGCPDSDSRFQDTLQLFNQTIE